jgi:hypothetical protein
MGEPLARSSRQVAIADHLWETLALISQDMGVDRDGLVNQALFAFARQHGYLAPSPSGRVAVADAGMPMAPTATAAGRPVAAPAPAAMAPASIPGPATYAPGPASAPAPIPTPAAVDPVLFDDPLPPLNAPMPRMATHPGMEAPIIFGPPSSAAPASAEPEPEPEAQVDVAAPALDLDNAVPIDEPPPAAADAPIGTLVLYAEGREVDRVTGPRFLIGRGKHCDLIINSGKVSREHAAIIREGEAYFIEDLGSSNGTWFDKKRISRRRIDNGDEYFVCSEKITCRFE